jgi:glycosyltransferase involved in cell wall biosynthesis
MAIEARLRVALIYDMDACKNPTGVTRHAMAQLRGLAARPDVALRAVSGRIREPDGLAFWEDLAPLPRREMPLRTRDMLRLWRMTSWPPAEWWTGPVDWVYSPAEYAVPVKKAKRAVTSHDVLQDLTIGGPRRRDRLTRSFGADLILSVSHFNTARLVEAFPEVRDRVAYVPNAADDLFFELASDRERGGARADLGLPPGMPYLLSVANFQARKNLARLVRSAGKLAEVARGDMAVVLLGSGTDAEANAIRLAIADLPRSAVIKMPGYRQGRALRAAYAEATALVFPSTCESFGIPAVEAMACGCPVALADSTALPEIGGDAGWYFDPASDEAITAALRDLIDRSDERSRRVERGREIAAGYRWKAATDLLVARLIERR